MPADPPLITISDPNRPGLPVDVVGSGHERDPWRPQRWHLLTMALAVVVALAVAVPVVLVKQSRADAALDRAAVQAVSLVGVALDEVVEDDPTVVLIGLRNDGATPVHLISLDLQEPGYQPVPIDAEAGPAAIVQVRVPDQATCSAAMAAQDLETPLPAAVRVRTARGTEAEVPVLLLSTPVQQLRATARSRCRYLPPDQAFTSVLGTARRTGTTLVVTMGLSNQGRLPLQVRRLEAPAGLTVEVTPRLPLNLSPEPLDSSGVGGLDGIEVTLRLRVQDCALARTSLREALDFGGDFSLNVEVAGADGQGSVQPLGVYQDGPEPLQELVTAVCGDLRLSPTH